MSLIGKQALFTKFKFTQFACFYSSIAKSEKLI